MENNNQIDRQVVSGRQHLSEYRLDTQSHVTSRCNPIGHSFARPNWICGKQSSLANKSSLLCYWSGQTAELHFDLRLSLRDSPGSLLLFQIIMITAKKKEGSFAYRWPPVQGRNMKWTCLLLMAAAMAGVSQACSCTKRHPQEHYCSADFGMQISFFLIQQLNEFDK